jgi:formylglycine-generating enzyme
MSLGRLFRSAVVLSLGLGLAATGFAESGDLKEDTNSLGMKFVQVPAGEFQTGSPETETERLPNETPHRVTISRPFWLGATHVTVGQFSEFVKATGYQTAAEKQGWATGAWDLEGKKWSRIDGSSWKDPSFKQETNHPVVCVTWHDAQAFCDWLSKKEGRKYRLPTEAEWEYASRAGTTTSYFWGADPKAGEGKLNGNGTNTAKLFPFFPPFLWSDEFVHTSPVGTFPPNAWGLSDMLGNTLQWCGDWFGEYPTDAVTDPVGPTEGKERVLRGGAFVYGPKHCRVAFRGRSPPDFQNFYIGFRVVREADALKKP